jgi:hypothetical protein
VAVLTQTAAVRVEGEREPPKPQRRVWAALFAWRRKPGFGRVEAIVLALYCALVGAIIPFHEPWGDEAHAWMIARDNSAWEIIRYRLHYEGAPPLWHLLLHWFHMFGGRYGAIDWFGAVFAAAGVVVLLRWSPFPLAVRCLLPFTFFFAYQYAVISRGYVLFGLLAFGLCALYGNRRRIVWFAVVAGLLTNLSMQGIVFSSLLALLYLWDLYRGRTLQPMPWKPIWRGLLVFVPMAVLACYTALPAPDVNFIAGNAASGGILHSLSEKWIGYSPRLYATDAPQDPWQPDEPELPEPNAWRAPGQWLAWYVDHRDVKSARGDLAQEGFLQNRIEDFFSVISQATWPVANSNLLACAFLASVVLWLWKRRGLRMLIPWGVLLIVGQVLWSTDHHMGMILIVLLAGIWLGYTRNPDAVEPVWLERSFMTLFLVVLLLQIGWTGYCADRDIHEPYDPGKATAEYMKAHPVARTAAFHFWSVSVQPYFKRSPFFNIRTGYWFWSWPQDPDPYYRTAVAAHPDRIVYTVEFPGPGIMRNQWVPIGRVTPTDDMRELKRDYLLHYFHAHGYVETHRFCGTRFSRFSSSFIACDLILEPRGPDPLPMQNAMYANPDDSE